MKKNINELKNKSTNEPSNKIVLSTTTNDEILSNFEGNNMNDQKFYSIIFKFGKDEIVLINKEIKNFVNWINDYSIFLNNICVILANDYWSFNDISLQVIEYLKAKAKNNDINKLEEIHKKISDSLQ